MNYEVQVIVKGRRPNILQGADIIGIRCIK